MKCIKLFAFLYFLTNIPVRAESLPAKVLGLGQWKLTLPIGEGDSKHAKEILQPALDHFSDGAFFHVKADGTGVVFRAPCGGATTEGSGYPRSELREMSDAKTKASWGTNDGLVHQMELIEAVLHTPEKKPQVVCAQVHDAQNAVLKVRLEGHRLFVERKDAPDVILNDHYQLGAKFQIRIKAGKGSFQLWCDDVLAMTWQTDAKGCYFKAGCYTQSNVEKGDLPDSYGEVVIYKLRLSHAKPEL